MNTCRGISDEEVWARGGVSPLRIAVRGKAKCHISGTDKKGSLGYGLPFSGKLERAN